MHEQTHTIGHLVNTISDKLYGHFTFPEEHAWWILEAITHKKKSDLMVRNAITLTKDQQVTIDKWLHALINEHMPLQYLIGSVPFGDLTILVEPPVLIPRPETEEWCLALGDQLARLENQKLYILDLCTGSGCIALSLAHRLPKATIVGSDISHAALALAKKNSIRNGITNAMFVHSDLFASLPSAFTFDCIVANPPYIAPSEWSSLDPSVSQWEDKNALIALDNGLDIIQKIITQAPQYLQSNKEMKEAGVAQLIIEIGYQQGPDAQALMERSGYCAAQTQKDLAQRDRVICGRVS